VENSKSFRSSCDRRVFPGHRLRGASALHNYLALIFHCSGRDDTERYAGKHQKEPGHEPRDTPSPGDYVRSPEPTGNLDSAAGQDVLTLLTRLNAEGTTIIIVTHSPEIAGSVPRTIRLRDGVVEHDTASQP
jgi:hypothetical protein